MKKALFTLAALMTISNADYEIFKSQTQEIGEVAKTEEVFFGEYKDFADKLAEGAKGGLGQALLGGIKGGVDMAGLGLIIGVLDPFIMGLYADQNYLKVVKLTDKDGKVAFVKTMLVGDKNPSYSEQEIHDLMNKGDK